MSATPCPHCGSTAKHGDRIGCCSGCGRLFSSMSAFARHRSHLTCHDPETRGLVPRHPKSDPDATMWGLPGGYDRTED